MDAFLHKAWTSRPEGGKAMFVEDDGTLLGAFRKSWASACKTAGVEHLIFHDLRRTAVRNMIDAGIPQSHAMYSGHKTDSIFRRYDIVSDDRLAAASAKMQTLFDQKLGTANEPERPTKTGAGAPSIADRLR